MDPKEKKQTLRMFTYGMYVATTAAGDDLAAGSVTWLSQASFEPPLLMIAVQKDSGLGALIEQSHTLAVNVLAADQKEVAQAFFRPTEVADGKINGYRFERGPETGAPLLVDLPAWCEARVTDTIRRGDHTVYLAEVINAGVRDPDADPMDLRDTGWSYGG
jgi:flavin reductase (DIM6/NTAB) family NADH-FMN oxidoreductase RutF